MAGNQISVTDARGNTTSFVYDGANRKTDTIFVDGTRIHTLYDRVGRKKTVTDQNDEVTTFEYDDVGRLTAVVDDQKGRTSYIYDEVGNKLTQTDAENRTTKWSYDNSGNVLTHTLPLLQEESFTYDAVGKVLTHTDFNNRTTEFEYSPCCGRLTRKTLPDETTEEYTYLGTGQIETVTTSQGLTEYEYDSVGRVTRRDNPDGTFISYGYDLAGNRTSLTVPSGTTGFTFDALNRLETVTAPDTTVTAYTYDAVGNRDTVSLPNGTMTSYTYDALNRLKLLKNRAADNSLISSYAYTLGLAGNRLQVDELSGRSVEYTYDSLYRLTDEEITDPVQGNAVISYTYDKVGNRETKTVGGVTQSYDYNDNDRLENDDTSTYLYDNNGNLTHKTVGSETIEYVYDDSNRLVQINHPTDGTTHYWYDHNGIRTAKQVNSSALHRYLVDANRDYAQVLEEYEGESTLAVSYLYGDDLIAQNRGDLSYYLYDGQLSSRQLVNSSGAVTDSYDYDAFGNLLNSSGSTENDYLYTGEQFDPNAGFYYLRARYYDQGSGRFTSVDPYAGNMHEPITLHRYLYAGDNPVMNVDPSGEMDYSLSSLMASTVIRGMLLNFSVSAAIGGADAALRGDPILAGAFESGVVGTLLGPLGVIKFVKPVLVVGGLGLGVVGIADAISEGNTELALFRGALLLNGAVTFVKTAQYKGRLGKRDTRAQNRAIADQLKARGWKITGGGGYIPHSAYPLSISGI
ncbi:MAG: RHS repeat-associated core domain-containing protein [Candidatus Electrothrix aestuarii]|uniref:RHS repeat-associated core domain-containing protein n=1 Tax=Candidatus Electrothrix aestuarii TaxID=3062594 RepID=A0AAU8M1W9_9BACT